MAKNEHTARAAGSLNRTAKFEILDWDDPIMEGTPYAPNRFVIEGIVPLSVAMEINALCIVPGACLDVFGLNELDQADLADETGRVIIDGLVPLAIAQQAEAICNAHNASFTDA